MPNRVRILTAVREILAATVTPPPRHAAPAAVQSLRRAVLLLSRYEEHLSLAAGRFGLANSGADLIERIPAAG
jgi:hypothetical protein